MAASHVVRNSDGLHKAKPHVSNPTNSVRETVARIDDLFDLCTVVRRARDRWVCAEVVVLTKHRDLEFAQADSIVFDLRSDEITR